MTYPERVDRAPEIRRALSSVRELCSSLDLLKGAKRQAGGNLIICCPSHGERNASCGVTLGPDGTVRVRCFSCGFGGDALHLVAAARGLDIKRDFPAVLREAAGIAGLDFEDLGNGAPMQVRQAPTPKPLQESTYPLASEVASVWQRCIPVTESEEVSIWLSSRGLDPATIDERELARALPEDIVLPRWASRERRSWFDTGHRLIMPVFDHRGMMLSLRAGQVIAETRDKRVPPSGHKAAGLLLANGCARALFAGSAKFDLLVVEGEPDFLTWASAVNQGGQPVAVVGIGSGWWSTEFAERLPAGTRVVIRTHQDPAGDKYAADIVRSLGFRCKAFRPAPDGFGDENDRLRAGRLARSFDADVAPMTSDAVDPASFPLGKLFAEHYWLGAELRRGVFSARCPGEILHTEGKRFDGKTVVREPAEGKSDGSFRCYHEACGRTYERRDVLENMMQRIASAEGL